MSERAALPKPGDPEAIYIIDVSAYVFRAYHALPPLSNSAGEPTHAVAGYCQMVSKLISDHQPAVLIAAMDPRKGSFRKELYPEYKANRPPTPPDLKQQMLRVKQACEAWGMVTLEAEGYEADDVIATLVSKGKKAGRSVVIVSADKDLLQLVGEGVVMFDSMRGRIFGSEETVEKLGVPPERVRDLLALMGDSSDNVPGVPSVGQKTATKLLGQWPDLDAIYANLDEVKGKSLKAKLETHRDQAYLSRDLVSLRDDVPIDIDLVKASFDPNPPTALRALFKELEFTRLLSRSKTDAPIEASYETILGSAALTQLLQQLQMHSRCALLSVLEPDEVLNSTLIGIALAWAPGEAVYIPLAHRYIGAPAMLSEAEVFGALKPVLENSLIAKCADLKRETMLWAERGIELRGVEMDSMLASYVLDPARRAHDLVSIVNDEYGEELKKLDELRGSGRNKTTLDMVEIDEVTALAGALADFSLRVAHNLEIRLGSTELRALYDDIEKPLARVLANMERCGIRLDTQLLSELSLQAETQLEQLTTRCYELAGQEFNIASPRQLETILFDELELPVIKKTKTARSTDQQVLEELSLLHELPVAILEHRQLAKLKSTYLDALPNDVNPNTGRIHSHFNQAVAATGRLSSSHPNLQNIPIRTEFGRRIRNAFIPAEGWRMMAADYSQIELRVLAHLSEDPELIDAYTQGDDVHRRTASALFDVTPEKVTREMRGQAKTVNFAVIYGQTQFALARNLKISRKEAKRYIDAFFERYAGVRAFMDQVIEDARETGYVTTLSGRRRVMPDLKSSNTQLRQAAERIARNSPIQGTAADIIKIAMVRIDAAIQKAGLQSRMLLSVHDELVFEAPSKEEKPLEQMVVELMQNAIELSVPITVDIGWGSTWGEAH